MTYELFQNPISKYNKTILQLKYVLRYLYAGNTRKNAACEVCFFYNLYFCTLLFVIMKNTVCKNNLILTQTETD